jgi:hypothetical protein
LGARLLAAVVTGIGIYTIRHFEAWGRKYSVYFVCFAADVSISASFLRIIPKSFQMSANAPVYLLSGFLHLLDRASSDGRNWPLRCAPPAAPHYTICSGWAAMTIPTGNCAISSGS